MTRAGAALAVVLATALAGCDPYYSVRSKALCPGADIDRVHEALRREGTMETRRVGKDRRGIVIGRSAVATFWCERGGLTASVHVLTDPGELEVSVGDVRRPKPDEVPVWRGHVEQVCADLSREIPEVGEWRTDDNTQGSWTLAVLPLAFFAAIAAFGVWVAHRVNHPRPREPQR